MPDQPYRILVTGSRNWTDYDLLALHLGRVVGSRPPGTLPVIVHGQCASGADAIAAGLARQYGYREEPHPADWAGFGKRAGFVRNADMVALGASVVLAFIMPCADPRCRRREREQHGSHGASHLAELAVCANIPVRRITSNG